uniref:Retrovirus-related Pol polyprotein from transposon TNT 1-94 n=1 Tax=Cajanus cajan TaxID=3821 RepID=A0A151RT80_CAJCA|nr:Retrovirus-related Pol polyprotein from transposon TNT 1-94 [Cajanus cajan]
MMETNTKMIDLNGANYHLWKGKIKDLLFVKKMYLFVFTTQKSDSMSEEDWDFEHQQVCDFIQQFVEDNVYNHIANEPHARTLWEKIESLYASKSGNNKLYLLNCRMNLRYWESSSISDHLNEFQGLLDQLSGMGIKFDDEVLGLWLLNTLPESWEKLEKCSHCMAGKQTRVSFKKHPPSRKLELLNLVHSDVCGPLKVKSFSGVLYFVTFIDDCSRKLWVYALQRKDQVLERFKQFHALVERQSGKKLKHIHTDNGGEYCGPFDVYCKQHGIAHEKTPLKTPQLNGLAERMNKTLLERVRCMLSDAKLPKHFWGEALYTTVHVINLTPTVILNSEVPDKIWFGKNASYDHLRVFSCKAFVHIPRDERSKLDAKTRQCIFIGYGEDEFGYMFYDPVEKKIVRSRDVQFMEVQTIEDIDKVEKDYTQER